MALTDPYNRSLNYLRISVTDRCNLRCTYCMPEEGIRLLSHKDIMTFEEIEAFTRSAVAMGINKVRITGGEPLVRKGIVGLIEKLATIPGIDDLSMSTNGQLLSGMAHDLAKAGLQRINISLDTCDPDKYNEITRGGDIRHVIQGIVAAQKAGLSPIKINCVVKKNAQEADAIGVKDFAERMNLQVRFIHLMNLHKGTFSVVEGGSGGDCSTCNRLRLTADGWLMPCLFNDIRYNVREMGYEQALMQATANKPCAGHGNTSGEFYNIGG